MSDDCGCGGNCGSGCSGECDRTCREHCDQTCFGCSGNCDNTCSTECDGCSGSCSGSCSGCTSCSSCSGCSGCTGSCTSACDNACTATSQAEAIANLGGNIASGNIIRADDFIGLKNAIEKEYTRRGKTKPAVYNPTVVSGGKVNLNAIMQVFQDCYGFNSSAANDWRSTVKQGDRVEATKIQPCVTFIKGLAVQKTKK